MRLTSIKATNVPPVKRFEASSLSDVIVLAGRNGVGKTRFLEALIAYFQAPNRYPHITITLEATCDDERQKWGTSSLDTSTPADRDRLSQLLQIQKIRGKWNSSVLYFESDRSIQQINPFPFSWSISDPYEEAVGWNTTFLHLKGRFQDTLHSIFRRVQAQKNKIAETVQAWQRQGHRTIDITSFPDPIANFKNAFSQLLAPKQLLDVDLPSNTLKYRQSADDTQEHALAALSSGEREVINIAFDFLLRNPNDCIVFFDEPELHLHPELSFRLIQTLKVLGKNNQFVFCTHSPDIITASLDHSVIFFAPPTDESTNQAIQVREDDATNQALNLLGQSVGIISLGKRIVLIEGTQSSLDKQTYGAIVEGQFPGLVLVPSGGKDLIRSFDQVIERVLSKTVWGVEFFMLCDRDVLPFELEGNVLRKAPQGRLQALGRYHLENYFLDEAILASIFTPFEPADSWVTSPDLIRKKLRELAGEMVSYAVALSAAAHFRETIGNIDIMPKNSHKQDVEALVKLLGDRAKLESGRVASSLEVAGLESWARRQFAFLTDLLSRDDERWKQYVPGRPLLQQFASAAKFDYGRLKRAYIAAAKDRQPSPFDDVIKIFKHFSV